MMSHLPCQHHLTCEMSFCSVLQCVAVCCSVLQCVAVCCSVLQCVAVSHMWDVICDDVPCDIYMWDYVYMMSHVWHLQKYHMMMWLIFHRMQVHNLKYEWVTSHIWMSHVSHMDSCEWVMPHMWYMNAISWHMMPMNITCTSMTFIWIHMWRRSEDQICSRTKSWFSHRFLGILLSEFRFTVFIPWGCGVDSWIPHCNLY